ncbi:MAG: hypothetical protein Q4G54_08450 [Pelistega sp.]|nr:hypothetical protein [Pelistega sp.]
MNNNLTQALDKLERILILEAGSTIEHNISKTAQRLRLSRLRLLHHVEEIGMIGDLSLILSTEMSILQGDLSRYSNSKEMSSSLKNALIEFDSAQRHNKLVQDGHEYHYVNLAHSLPKRRQAGLPLDEARQAFDSHSARLSNLNKARLDSEEKLIINARKSNIVAAKKVYVEQQKQALGIK